MLPGGVCTRGRGAYGDSHMPEFNSDLLQAPKMRAGDADRELVAESLRKHHADGRLDTDELQERLGSCYHARTLAELDNLLSDLPREFPATSHRRHQLGWWGRAPVLAITVLVALAVLAPDHHRHPPVAFLALILVGIALARTRRPRPRPRPTR
jgi:Domain of unknown function (DUF1707)